MYVLASGGVRWRLGLAFFKAAVFVEREVGTGRVRAKFASFNEELDCEANCDADKGDKRQKADPRSDFDGISPSGALAKLPVKLGESAIKRIIPYGGD